MTEWGMVLLMMSTFPSVFLRDDSTTMKKNQISEAEKSELNLLR